ncbi:unnamed protein product [Arctia plantaginis]|uniref:Uncharacterized protein n=1 Tax=Arctia plantaginis TaxID=874455 RepID=A0A8S0YNH1_ARCPL|nr:unnamed protein product [Arctia plantaginis]
MLLIYFYIIYFVTNYKTFNIPTVYAKSETVPKNLLHNVLQGGISYSINNVVKYEPRRRIRKRLISNDFVEYMEPNEQDYYYDRAQDDTNNDIQYDRVNSFLNNLNVRRKFVSAKTADPDISDISYEKSESTSYPSTDVSDAVTFTDNMESSSRGIDIFNSSEILDISGEENKVKNTKGMSNKTLPLHRGIVKHSLTEKSKGEITLQLEAGGPKTHYDIYKYKDYEDSNNLNQSPSPLIKVLLVTRLPEDLLEQKPSPYTVKTTTSDSSTSSPFDVKIVKYKDYPNYEGRNGYGKPSNITHEYQQNTKVTQEYNPIVKVAVPEILKDEAMFVEQRLKDSMLLKTNTTEIEKYDILRPLPKVTDY